MNAAPLTRRMGRWYHVATVDGVRRVECLEGADADNLRLELAGKLQDFAGWPPARMAGYRKWLRRIAEAGRAS